MTPVLPLKYAGLHRVSLEMRERAHMLEELQEDNSKLAVRLRGVHELCDERGDIAGASLIENWIDEAERRAWFLYETTR